MQVQATACDICRDIPALTYSITVSDGRKQSIDLCADHASSLEDLLQGIEPSRRRSSPGRSAPRKRRSMELTTLDEIEKQKETPASRD